MNEKNHNTSKSSFLKRERKGRDEEEEVPECEVKKIDEKTGIGKRVRRIQGDRSKTNAVFILSLSWILFVLIPFLFSLSVSTIIHKLQI